MEEALAVIERDAMAINRAPDLVLEEAHKAAEAITQVIEGKKKKVTFNGNTYLQFEDWQTLGRFYGVTAVVRSTRYVEFGEGDEKVRGFEAICDALLVATNQVISSAEALCLNDERNWSSKPLFQLKSMAQTRGCAKAMRNVLAWVVVLAGYSGTPAEEMTGDENGHQYVAPPQRKSGLLPPQAAQKQNAPLYSENTAPISYDGEVMAFDEIPDVKPKATDFNICPECGGSRIQPAGVSKQGRAYKSFCKDCADAKKKRA